MVITLCTRQLLQFRRVHPARSDARNRRSRHARAHDRNARGMAGGPGRACQLEAEQAERNDEIVRKRRDLPWVPVEKEYVFDTQDGRKTLAELFDGRSQLLAYNMMFGPDYTIGACPGCTSLARRARRLGRPPQPSRRDADLLLAGADRAAVRVQAADGLAVPVRLHLQHRLPLRLRARAHRGAGAAGSRAQGDDR